jgi:hypothetical protein
MINVPVDEFKAKWYVKDYGEDVYTNGSLNGTIQYEDDTYVVLKLTK